MYNGSINSTAVHAMCVYVIYKQYSRLFFHPSGTAQHTARVFKKGKPERGTGSGRGEHLQSPPKQAASKNRNNSKPDRMLRFLQYDEYTWLAFYCEPTTGKTTSGSTATIINTAFQQHQNQQAAASNNSSSSSYSSRTRHSSRRQHSKAKRQHLTLQQRGTCCARKNYVLFY